MTTSPDSAENGDIDSEAVRRLAAYYLGHMRDGRAGFEYDVEAGMHAKELLGIDFKRDDAGTDPHVWATLADNLGKIFAAGTELGFSIAVAIANHALSEPRADLEAAVDIARFKVYRAFKTAAKAAKVALTVASMRDAAFRIGAIAAPHPHTSALFANVAFWLRQGADSIDGQMFPCPGSDDFEVGDLLSDVLRLSAGEPILQCHALAWGFEIGAAMTAEIQKDPFGDHTAAAAAIVHEYRMRFKLEIEEERTQQGRFPEQCLQHATRISGAGFEELRTDRIYVEAR